MEWMMEWIPLSQHGGVIFFILMLTVVIARIWVASVIKY